MRRSLYLVGGLVLVVAGFLPALFLPASPVELVGAALFGVAGALWVVAARREAVALGSRSVPWYVFVGVGQVLAGIALPLSTVQTALAPAAGTGDLATFGLAVVAGLFFALFGVRTARGNRNDIDEPAP